MNQTTLIIIACIIMFVVIPSFKDRTISIRKLIIGPAVFIYLFYQSLIKDFSIFPRSYVVIAIGLTLGIIIGYLLRKPSKIIVYQNEKKITIKGSFIVFYTFIAIFIIHYIIGYTKAINPRFFNEITTLSQLLLLVFALVSSLTIGSNSCLFIKYLQQSRSLDNDI